MASSSIQIDSKQPVEYDVPELASCSTYVLKKQLIEVLPNENTTFSYTTNQFLRFNISSNSDVMLGEESYIRCQYQCSFTGATNTPTFNWNRYNLTYYANQEPTIRFPRLGPIAMFRSIEVRALSSGTTLYRVQNQQQALSFPFMTLSKLGMDSAAWHYGMGNAVKRQVLLQDTSWKPAPSSYYSSTTYNPDTLILCGDTPLTATASATAFTRLHISINETTADSFSNTLPNGAYYSASKYRSLLKPGDIVKMNFVNQ